MINPFEQICAPRLDNIVYEEVEGSFACQEEGCFVCMPEAKYFPAQKLLTWTCAAGHVCKVRNFQID